MAGTRDRVRSFCVSNEADREACEEVLTKYGPRGLGRIMKHESHFDQKSGLYYVALHWFEDIPEEEFRD